MARRDTGTGDLFVYAAARAADAEVRRRQAGEALRTALVRRALRLAGTPVGAEPRPAGGALRLAPITQEAFVEWVTGRGLASVRRTTDRRLRFITSAVLRGEVVGVACAVEVGDGAGDGPTAEVAVLVDPLSFGQTVADALRKGLGGAAAEASLAPATTLLLDAMARACRAAGYEWLVVTVPVTDPTIDRVLYPQAGYEAVPWRERGWELHGGGEVSIDPELESDDDDGGACAELPPEQRLQCRAPFPYRKHRSPPGFVSPWLRAGHNKASQEWADMVRRHRTDDQLYRVIGYEEARDEAESRLGRELDDLEHADLMERFGYDDGAGYYLPADVFADETDVGEELYRQFVYRTAVPINPVEAPIAAGDPGVAVSLLVCRQIDVDEANVALAQWHSHLKRAVRGHIFSLAVYATPSRFNDAVLLGVLVASYPKSRHTAAQRPTVEINRVAIGRSAPEAWRQNPGWFGLWDEKRGKPHAVGEASFLLARARQIGEAMGFDRFVSHVLLGEQGTSYLAVGWVPVAIGRGGEHGRESRPRAAAEQDGVKVRLEIGPGAARPPKGHADAVRGVMREASELVRDGVMVVGGEAPEAVSPATLANGRSAEARAQSIFRERRRAFASTFPSSLAARAELVIVDGPCPLGGSNCAWRDLAVSVVRGPDAGVVRVARRMLDLDDGNLRGIFDHELGHLADSDPGREGAERRADRLAQRATGDRVYYDRDDVQTTNADAPGAQSVRPRHLHR